MRKNINRRNFLGVVAGSSALLVSSKNVQATGECKHLNFQVRGQDTIGTCYCPDCGEKIRMNVAFQNLADAMREKL